MKSLCQKSHTEPGLILDVFVNKRLCFVSYYSSLGFTSFSPFHFIFLIYVLHWDSLRPIPPGPPAGVPRSLQRRRWPIAVRAPSPDPTDGPEPHGVGGGPSQFGRPPAHWAGPRGRPQASQVLTLHVSPVADHMYTCILYIQIYTYIYTCI